MLADGAAHDFTTLCPFQTNVFLVGFFAACFAEQFYYFFHYVHLFYVLFFYDDVSILAPPNFY
jgi:hypothetical protein